MPQSVYRKIPQTPVTSSMFTSVGHDGAETLVVTMTHSGRLYRHWPVSAEQFHELLADKSLGQFYNRNIKGKCSCELVPEDTPDE